MEVKRVAALSEQEKTTTVEFGKMLNYILQEFGNSFDQLDQGSTELLLKVKSILDLIEERSK